MYLFMHVFLYFCIYMYICKYIYIHLCMYLSICLLMYLCIYVFMYLCIYLNTWTLQWPFQIQNLKGCCPLSMFKLQPFGDPITAGQVQMSWEYVSWLVLGPPLWKMMEFVNWDDESNPNQHGKIKLMATKPPTSFFLDTIIASSSNRWAVFRERFSDVEGLEGPGNSGPAKSWVPTQDTRTLGRLELRQRAFEKSCLHLLGFENGKKWKSKSAEKLLVFV